MARGQRLAVTLAQHILSASSPSDAAPGVSWGLLALLVLGHVLAAPTGPQAMPLVPSHQCPADTLQACSQSTVSPLLTQPWLAAGHGTASRSLSSTPDLCLRVAVHHPCTHGRPAPFPGGHTGNAQLSLAGLRPHGAWRQLPPRGPRDAKQGRRLSLIHCPSQSPPQLAPHPLPLWGQSPPGDVGTCSAILRGSEQGVDFCCRLVSSLRAGGSGGGHLVEGSPQSCPARRGGRKERSGNIVARPTGLASCCGILLGVSEAKGYLSF